MADSLLRDAVDSFNERSSLALYMSFNKAAPRESFTIHLDKYRFQYFPKRDFNGKRVMTIMDFSTGFQSWKTEIYQPKTHYGMQMIELEINFIQRTRGKIHSADFG
jgi:hypothetical protein